MTPLQIAVLVIVIAAAAGTALAFFLLNRTKKLRNQFGPEYDRTVEQTGNRFKAEARLEKLEKRVRGYSLQPLSSADRDRFQQSWRNIQSAFVDDPGRAFTEADQLLGKVMAARGYPVADFDQRAAEIAVDHSVVAENYRAGHDVAVRYSQNKATTEDLRKGMIHYRALFDELMEERAPLRARAAGQN